MIISVIIPHFNQSRHLVRCLESLAGQNAPGVAVEIIVVDNGSVTLPTDEVSVFESSRLIVETIPGPGPARNAGVGQSRGEILAFIDADCVAGPNWIATIVDHIEAGANILGGDVRILHKDMANPTIWEAYESEYAFRMEHYIRNKGFTGTGNLAMRRDVFDAVGPFSGIDVAEDRDWGRRAGAKGLRITWVPTMLVFHPARDSFAELARKWDRHTAHDFQVQLDRSFGRLRWAGLCIMMVLSPLGEVARIATSDRIKGGPRGRLLASLGLLRTRLYRAWRMSQLIFAKDAAHLADRWREDR